MSKESLDTGIGRVRNVDRLLFGSGSLKELPSVTQRYRQAGFASRGNGAAVVLVDDFFASHDAVISAIGVSPGDWLHFVSAQQEPSTLGIDKLVAEVRDRGLQDAAVVIGIGGGSVLDTAKAVSNLLTNDGNASSYQGWDLVPRRGTPKIGVPTISGTGAEATRTCVMINTSNGLKLGMNSEYSVFDEVLLDPALSRTVPRDQYFWTGMDAYIHCLESLSGRYRHPIGDAYSRETLSLCREVFASGSDMLSDLNRERLMVASYLGGCAIATSFVGLVHPLSAALSVVLGVHHCVGNCIVMRAMREFYPTYYDEFWRMVEAQAVEVPRDVCQGLNAEQHRALYEATIIHAKPLTNALGPEFRTVLSPERVAELFARM